MSNRIMPALAVACAGLLVFAASAGALAPKKGLYKGKTAQGEDVVFRVAKERSFPCPDDPFRLCTEKAKKPWVVAGDFYVQCPKPDFFPMDFGFINEKPRKHRDDGYIPRGVKHPRFFVFRDPRSVSIQIAEDPEQFAEAEISGYVGGRWKSKKKVKGTVHQEIDFASSSLTDCDMTVRWTARRTGRA